MTADEKLTHNVEAIVNGVVARFPGFVQKMLQPHKQRLVRNIVKTSSAYVDDKIRESKPQVRK